MMAILGSTGIVLSNIIWYTSGAIPITVSLCKNIKVCTTYTIIICRYGSMNYEPVVAEKPIWVVVLWHQILTKWFKCGSRWWIMSSRAWAFHKCLHIYGYFFSIWSMWVKLAIVLLWLRTHQELQPIWIMCWHWLVIYLHDVSMHYRHCTIRINTLKQKEHNLFP